MFLQMVFKNPEISLKFEGVPRKKKNQNPQNLLTSCRHPWKLSNVLGILQNVLKSTEEYGILRNLKFQGYAMIFQRNLKENLRIPGGGLQARGFSRVFDDFY